jgi:hypothetical protein
MFWFSGQKASLVGMNYTFIRCKTEAFSTCCLFNPPPHGFAVRPDSRVAGMKQKNTPKIEMHA